MIIMIYIYIYISPIGYAIVVLQRLFTLPVSRVMFQTSVNNSTPKFCTPSLDNTCTPIILKTVYLFVK